MQSMQQTPSVCLIMDVSHIKGVDSLPLCAQVYFAARGVMRGPCAVSWDLWCVTLRNQMLGLCTTVLEGMMCTQERGCDVKELIVGNWIMWLV